MLLTENDAVREKEDPSIYCDVISYSSGWIFKLLRHTRIPVSIVQLLHVGIHSLHDLPALLLGFW
jgi:hypothetical protein